MPSVGGLKFQTLQRKPAAEVISRMKDFMKITGLVVAAASVIVAVQQLVAQAKRF